MPASITLVLNAGGLRSLVATAASMMGGEATRVVLLHLKDDRPTAAMRREHVRRQAEHFNVADVIALPLPHLQSGTGFADQQRTDAATGLLRTQVMLTAMAQAAVLGATRLIYPAQANGDFDALARATESLVLLRHLASLEVAKPKTDVPLIESPLLELSDQQLVELGNQLGVPWELAWTCTVGADAQCKVCPACRRRLRAFQLANTPDPVTRPAAAEVR